MALFNQSTITFQQACQQIADAVGLSADGEATTRAFRSLNAGIEYLNGRAKWEFTLTEADPITIAAPFGVGGVSASAGQSSALLPSGHGLLPDDLLSFTGLSVGTRIAATASGSITLAAPISSGIGTGVQTVSATAIRDMYALPSAFRSPYSARTYGTPSTLRPVRRRFYDRSVSNEFSPSTPVAYDVFPIGAKGKLRLLPPPANADVLQLRYYARIPVATASGDSGALGVPQDYENYLIAWAKWHYIVDQGEGKKEQAQTWISFANDGIRTMLADQTTLPDEDLQIIPGAHTYDPAMGPNSTRVVDWDY